MTPLPKKKSSIKFVCTAAVKNKQIGWDSLICNCTNLHICDGRDVLEGVNKGSCKPFVKYLYLFRASC